MYNLENTIIYLVIRVVLLLILLILGGKLIFDKRKLHKVSKIKIAFTILTLILFILANIFMINHKIYYKYCDSWIMGKSIEQVKERYGEFDYLRENQEQGGGQAGYFIYHDDGLLPDYQDHYLMIEYDKAGFVTRVFDGSQ